VSPYFYSLEMLLNYQWRYIPSGEYLQQLADENNA